MPWGSALSEGLAGYLRHLRTLLEKQMREQAEEKGQQRWMTQTQTLEDFRRSAEERAAERDVTRRRQEREEHLADPVVQATRARELRDLDPAVQAARNRMTNYWPRFTRAQLQANPQLLAQFQKDNELLGGAIPMQTTPETKEVRTPGMMPTTVTPPPSLSDALRGVAQTQQVPTGRDVVSQVPTGRDLTLPILPEPATQRVVLVDNTGRIVQDIQVPEGTQVKTVTAPTPQHPARFIITDSKGNVVREIEAPPGTQMRVLPAPPRAGGSKVSTEGLTAAEQRVVSNYNRLIDQRDRLTGMLTQNPLGDKDPLKARIDAQMAEVDAQIARLRPQIDQIFYGKTASPARTGTTDVNATAAVTEDAKNGVPWENVEAVLRKNGVDPAPYRTIYDSNAKKALRPPSDLLPVVKGYKSEGRTWAEARVLLMRKLVGWGYAVAEAKKIVDDPSGVKGAFDRAPARR